MWTCVYAFFWSWIQQRMRMWRSHLCVSTDLKIRRVLVAFTFVSVRPSPRVMRRVYVCMICLDFEIRASVFVHEFIIRRKQSCRDNTIVSKDIIAWSAKGSWNFLIRIAFMSWSSRNIAITDECMHEDWEAMRRYQRKSHREEHAFWELTMMPSSMMKEMTKVKIRILDISMSLFRTPPLQRRSCHAKRDRVRRRQLSCSVVVDEKKSFLLCVSRTLLTCEGACQLIDK